jgi:hypothetical protein
MMLKIVLASSPSRYISAPFLNRATDEMTASRAIPSLTFASEIRDALAQFVASCEQQPATQFAAFLGS